MHSQREDVEIITWTSDVFLGGIIDASVVDISNIVEGR